LEDLLKIILTPWKNTENYYITAESEAFYNLAALKNLGEKHHHKPNSSE